jgi:hypothetical protein
MVVSVSMPVAPIEKCILRRRRFQRGSLQKRKFANGWQWIGFWWVLST